MASIVVSSEKISFQGNVEEQFIKQNGIIYSVFIGEYENNAVKVMFDLKLKQSFVKSKDADLIKTDHMILQKTTNGYFLLFESDKKDYKEEDGVMAFDESVQNKQYEYNFHFVNANADNAQEEQAPAIDPTDVSGMVNAILKKYGVEEKSEDVSPVTEYMKTWSLEHPDQK